MVLVITKFEIAGGDSSPVRGSSRCHGWPILGAPKIKNLPVPDGRVSGMAGVWHPGDSEYEEGLPTADWGQILALLTFLWVPVHDQ